MSQQPPTPTASVPQVVAVTGASGYIGERLVDRLVHAGGIRQVIGVDLRPTAFEHEKLVSLQQDITEPLDSTFRRYRVEAVVHLAFVLRQLRSRRESHRVNVGGASNVLWACEAAGVKRIVLMSSSTVYGAHPDNVAPLTEEAPLRPPKGFSYARDKAECEWFYNHYLEQREGTELSILRGCVVMGPNAENFVTRALSRPVLVGVGKQDPPMQFLHEDDLIEVLWRFVSEPHPGTYNVAGPGSVPWSDVVRMAGKRLVRFSAPMAYAITNLTWALHLQSDAPAAGLDFIRWPWLVSTERLERELGYAFEHTSLDAVQSHFGVPDDPLAGLAAADDDPSEGAG